MHYMLQDEFSDQVKCQTSDKLVLQTMQRVLGGAVQLCLGARLTKMLMHRTASGLTIQLVPGMVHTLAWLLVDLAQVARLDAEHL